MSHTYIEDWDEEKHGKFPVRSQRFAGKRQVRLEDERGIWAGWCKQEEREIGKLVTGVRDAPSVVSEMVEVEDKEGNLVTVERRRPLTDEELAEYPLLPDEDTRRTLPAQYVRVALVELSAKEEARKARETAANEAALAKQQQRKNAKEAIRSKRENGEPLTSEDIGVLADLVTGRELG